MGRSGWAVLALLLGTHFLVSGGLAPDWASVRSFTGMRGLREVWIAAALLIAFGIYLSRTHLWAGAFVVWATISGVWSIWFIGRPYVFVFYDLYYLAALTAFFVFAGRLNAATMAKALVCIALFNVAWLPLQLWGIDPVWHFIRPDELLTVHRLVGWLGNQTTLVHFLAMVVPLAAALSWWLVIPLVIPVLLATKTLPILAAVLSIIVSKRLWTRRLGGAVIPLVAAAIFYIGLYDPPKLGESNARIVVIKDSMRILTVGLREKSYRDRQSGKIKIYRDVPGQPIFGHGPGSYKSVFVRYLLDYPHGLGTARVRDPDTNTLHTQPKTPTWSMVYHHPSSEPVKAVFELGWPILLIMVGWSLSLLRKVVRSTPDKWTDAYAGASVAFLISMLGYQPTSIPSLIVSGLIIWGIYERRISNAEKR